MTASLSVGRFGNVLGRRLIRIRPARIKQCRDQSCGPDADCRTGNGQTLAGLAFAPAFGLFTCSHISLLCRSPKPSDGCGEARNRNACPTLEYPERRGFRKMMSRIISALIGREIDRRDGKGGAKGALIGAAAPAVLRRLGPVGLVLGGAYVAKKAWDRHRQG